MTSDVSSSKPDWARFADVERDAETLSGAWRLKGTRIRPEDILSNADMTPEEIAEQFPPLTPERVRSVIAYATDGAHAHPA